ncbi:MAG: polyribonucleotide nucleotidyltransferase [Chitinophagaceae bacterium]
MFRQPICVSIDLGNENEIFIETGKLARQANGSVTIRQGNCIMLATVCAKKEPKEGQDFFPLTVDYMEKYSSAGKIPGSFFKREGKLSDYEVLISRLVDRAIRPLFPEDYFCDVQIIITLLSSDPNVAPDSLAGLAASAALAVSDVPITEYISEVRVARINGDYIINPSPQDIAKADIELMVGGSKKNLVMIEGESKECSEEDFIKSLQIAHDAIKKQIKAQLNLREQVGNPTKADYKKPITHDELKKEIENYGRGKVLEVCRSKADKQKRTEELNNIIKQFIENKGESFSNEHKDLSKKYYEDLKWEIVRNIILDENIRLDGRDYTTIRPLTMETDFLPTPHGSALFTRGETQALATVTLGTKLDEQLLESASFTEYAKFLLHYNFPPYSTGEVKPLRSVGRREIGHGNLALRSLKALIPDHNDYPYTIRVVSEVLESNGSSSMATVCASSLALMDAGVPFPKHVAGIAMGLITRKTDNKYAILTDILGDEDHLGDMDFKLTGTREGICGVQMDIKIDGLSMELMAEAIEHAKKARLFILDKLYNCIPTPRSELKVNAPRCEKLIIDKEFIGAVIGPQGKVIQEIQRVTEATITIEEIDNKGIVSIFSNNKAALEKALQTVKGIVAVPIIGEIYKATVKSIQPYGAFIEFLPGKQGLLHISEIEHRRLENLDGILTENDVIQVKLIGMDNKTGKFKFSRKVLLPKEN